MGDEAARNGIEEQRRLCRLRFGAVAGRKMSQWMRDYRASFLRGFGEAISNRFLIRYQLILEAEEAVAGKDSPALVRLRSDEIATRNFVAARSRPATSREQARVRDGSGSALNPQAYALGHQNGDSVALTDKRLVA